MIKITKAICHKCKKEIDYNDWYYSVDDIKLVGQSSTIGVTFLKKRRLL